VASSGTRVRPAPAATRLSRTAKSVARATTRGTNPARAQARWIISAQLVRPRGARNGWPGRRWWAGSAVALAGTAVIAVSHGLGFGAAALVVLAAAVLQGIFHTAQKPLLARYTSVEVTAYAMWAGTVFILPWAGSLLRALPQAGGTAIGAAAFLGVAPSALGFVLWGYAMARMTVGRVTTSLYLVPAAAIVISLAWLGQVPGLVELIGGAVALAGVVLAGSRPRGRRPRDAGEVAQVREPASVRQK
jgi:drug/metabolite transporter (DMT)-like permease